LSKGILPGLLSHVVERVAREPNGAISPKTTVKNVKFAGYPLRKTCFTLSPLRYQQEVSIESQHKTHVCRQCVTLGKQGFKTLRLPVAWVEHIGLEPDYAIAEARFLWMDTLTRVLEANLGNGK